MNRTFLASLCAVFSSAALLLVIGCGGSSPADNGTANLVSPAAQHNGIQLANPAANMSGRLIGNVFTPDSTRPQGLGFASTHHVFLNGRSSNQPAAFSGWTPAQLRTCYGITGNGSGTIVIVDAFDDPTALADFNQYSAQYGLPQETSTNVTSSSNQHLQVVYAQRKPRYNQGWSQEESLDIELAHAMAPNAKIVLIECATNSNANLYGGDDLAPSYGAQCSNSWSGGEASGESASDGHFNHPGTIYFFSGGDTGGVKGYPSTSVNVVSVGGTNLSLNANNTRATETAWTDSGCGLSSYEPAASFQAGIPGLSAHRGDDDISAVGDPNTGVSIRWNGGWYIAGGTSVSCPMIAAMVNTSGTNRGSGPAQNATIYAARGTGSLFDVVSGTAGSFSAGPGWDYPTGCGTPNGTGAF